MGRHLLEHLAEQGDEVLATSRTAVEGFKELNVVDKDAVREVVSEFRPEAIIHLAAISFVPQAEEDFDQALAVNVAGTDHVCRAVSEVGLKCRVVLASSSEVYGRVGEGQMPIQEEQPLCPITNYGLTKSFSEQVVRRWRGEGVEGTIMRPFNHIGPGQSDRFVASSFARQLAKIALGKEPAVLKVGNLAAKRDFTDVRDIVRGYRLAAEKGGDVYQLCSVKAIAIQELLDTLICVSGVAVDIQQEAGRTRSVEISVNYGSNDRAHQDLGWQPEIDLERTLGDVYEDWHRQESQAPSLAGR